MFPNAKKAPSQPKKGQNLRRFAHFCSDVRLVSQSFPECTVWLPAQVTQQVMPRPRSEHSLKRINNPHRPWIPTLGQEHAAPKMDK